MQGQFVIPDFAGQHRARGYPVRGAVQDAEMFAEPAHRPPAAGEDDHDHDVEEPPKANCEGGGKDTVDDRQRTLLDEFRSTKKSKGN